MSSSRKADRGRYVLPSLSRPAVCISLGCVLETRGFHPFREVGEWLQLQNRSSDTTS
jgi:hypothetical protein